MGVAEKSHSVASIVVRRVEHQLSTGRPQRNQGAPTIMAARRSVVTRQQFDDTVARIVSRGSVEQRDLQELSFLCTASNETSNFTHVDIEAMVALVEVLDRQVKECVASNLMEEAIAVFQNAGSPSAGTAALDQVSQLLCSVSIRSLTLSSGFKWAKEYSNCRPCYEGSRRPPSLLLSSRPNEPICDSSTKKPSNPPSLSCDPISPSI